MKKTILTIAVFVIASMSLYAQDTTTKSQSYTREGDTFIQKDSGATPFRGDQVTAYKWRDSKGNEYPIILHTYTKGEKKGRTTCYVIRTSQKSGKEYHYYLPGGEKIAEEIINENNK